MKNLIIIVGLASLAFTGLVKNSWAGQCSALAGANVALVTRLPVIESVNNSFDNPCNPDSAPEPVTAKKHELKDALVRSIEWLNGDIQVIIDRFVRVQQNGQDITNTTNAFLCADGRAKVRKGTTVATDFGDTILHESSRILCDSL